MGVKEDVEGAAKLWKNSSWLTKLFVAVSILTSTSSIASLSESVFKWKGFILDGLTYYQKAIVPPILELLNFTSWSYSDNEVHILVITSLVTGGSIRSIHFIESNSASKDIHFIIVQYIALFLGFSLLLYILGTDSNPFQFNQVLLTTLILMVLPLIYIATVKSARNPNVYRLLAAVYSVPLMSCALVVVLAAINVGLTKPTP